MYGYSISPEITIKDRGELGLIVTITRHLWTTNIQLLSDCAHITEYVEGIGGYDIL